MDHDREDVSTPATRCAAGIMPVAVSLSNAPPTATPSSAMGPQTLEILEVLRAQLSGWLGQAGAYFTNQRFLQPLETMGHALSTSQVPLLIVAESDQYRFVQQISALIGGTVVYSLTPNAAEQLRKDLRSDHYFFLIISEANSRGSPGRGCPSSRRDVLRHRG
jgi:hypothetical protein